MSSTVNKIMEYDVFKTATSGGPRGRKSLETIDGLLQSWHNFFKHNATLHMQGLVPLATACTGYLNVKRAKRDSKRKPSRLQLKRIAMVERLAHQVFARLAYSQHAKMKAGGGQGDALRGATMRPLQPAYVHERTDFTAGGKTTSAPKGVSFLKQQIGAATAERGMDGGYRLPPNLAPLLDRQVGQLSTEEFNLLHSHFVGEPATIGHSATVHFAKKDERLRHLMLVPIDGKLYNTRGDLPDGRFAYAIDMHGNLIVAPANMETFADGGNLNHSSLCAGREVVCAGVIQFATGDITSISNESGHYMPSSRQLMTAIRVLIEEYDLELADDVEVSDMEGGSIGPLSGFHPVEN